MNDIRNGPYKGGPRQMTWGEVRLAFWARVEKTPTCWNWQGSQNKFGGQFYARGTLWRAHRLAYVLLDFQLSDSAWLYRTCRNALCVNPEHMKVQELLKYSKTKKGLEDVKRENAD